MNNKFEPINGELTIWRSIHYLTVKGTAVDMLTGKEYEGDLTIQVITQGKSRVGIWSALYKKLKEETPEGYTIIRYEVLEDKIVQAGMPVSKFLANAEKIIVKQEINE